MVVVGAGGRGGADVALTDATAPVSYAIGGDSSSFGEVIALGGGAGGSAPYKGFSATDDVGKVALPTPSTEFPDLKATGGGGLGQSFSQPGASGSVSPERNGGNGTADVTNTFSGNEKQRAGGGGGAGGNGTAGSGTTSGNGGVGVASSISGTDVEYGSGGGGGKRTGGSSGSGGALPGSSTAGGDGGRDAAGSNGVVGRGGGGGGGSDGSPSGTSVGVGGDGGSGVVIVRVALPS